MRRLWGNFLWFIWVGLSCPAFAQESWPSDNWEKAAPTEVGMASTLIDRAIQYARSTGGSGCITRYGKLVARWDKNGATPELAS